MANATLTAVVLTGDQHLSPFGQGAVLESITAARFAPGAILRFNHGHPDSFTLGQVEQWWLDGEDEWVARFAIDKPYDPRVRQLCEDARAGRLGISAGYRTLSMSWSHAGEHHTLFHDDRQNMIVPSRAEIDRVKRGEQAVESFVMVSECSIVRQAADPRCRVLDLQLPGQPAFR